MAIDAVVEIIALGVVILIILILAIVTISVFAAGNWRKGIWVSAWTAGLSYFVIYWIFDKKFFGPTLNTAASFASTAKEVLQMSKGVMKTRKM
jgi:hypothetical protein